MHPDPDLKQLEESDEPVTGLVDQAGNNLFGLFIGKAQEFPDEGGSVDYMWPPVEGVGVPHTAFVQLLFDWGWVLGTGLPQLTIEAYDMPIEPGATPPDDRIRIS